MNSFKKVEGLYDKIFSDNRAKIEAGGCADQYLLHPEQDNRRSLALVLRPDREICDKIQICLNEIRNIEPQLYYYPAEDFHATVLGILRCKENRTLPEQEVMQGYINCIKEATKDIEPFEVRFEGLTASDNAVLVKGYYEENLEKLRQKLRKLLRERNLMLDERYETFSCHTTVVRIPEKINAPDLFIEKILENKNREFGAMMVKSIEMVFHNWYDSQKTLLYKFGL